MHRGLGRVTAIALAQAGAGVGLLARSRGDLEQVAAEIGRVGGRALVLAADLARSQELTGAEGQVDGRVRSHRCAGQRRRAAGMVGALLPGQG